MANINKKDELPLSNQPGGSLLKVPPAQSAPQPILDARGESPMSLFVYDPKAHKPAPEPKQAPAPEQPQALVVEPAPLTASNANEQTPLAKLKAPPAPVTKPNPSQRIKQRQAPIVGEVIGYEVVKAPKQTSTETGEQLRQRLNDLPANEKPKALEGFTAKQKLLLHETTRAEARRVPNANLLAASQVQPTPKPA